MSLDFTILFDELFALRIQYQDYINEEYIIINKLKNKLIDFGVEESELNNVLFNFYNYFDIPVTMNQIENVPLHSAYSLYYHNDDNHNDDDNSDSENSDFFESIENEPQYFSTIIYTHNVNNLNPINNLFNLLFNNQPEQYEDVVVTTDINSLNNLPICKITNDMQIICLICQEEMNENEEYINIECKHIFHRTCLTTYLENYNHICPTCRKEIGTPNIHI